MRRDAMWLFGLALWLGCGKTTDPLSNKNTNWLRDCVIDATCGKGLTCECGVCTTTCTTATQCGANADGVACKSTTSAALAAQCGRREADDERAICVASCGAGRDCEAYGAGWECREAVCSKTSEPRDAGTEASDAGASTPDAAGMDGAAVDAGSDAATDAGSAGDALEPFDAGPVRSSEVMCETDGDLAGTGPFEVVATEIFETGAPPLAIAPDGAIYTAYTPSGLRLIRIEGSTKEPFASDTDFPAASTLVVDGGDLFVGWNDTGDSAGMITKVDLTTQAPINLARELGSTVRGIAIEGDWVYWMASAYDPPSPPGQVWRSPRTPGTSQLIGELDGYLLQDRLFLAGDALLVLAQSGTPPVVSLYRIAKDGSGDVRLLSDAPAELADLGFDGQDAFVALGGVDALGNPSATHGIARMNPDTLASQLLFDTGQDTPSRVTLDDTYAYWFIDDGFQDDIPSGSIWRGRKDGRGDAHELASFHGWMMALAAQGGSLYWLAGCEDETKSHLVRVPSP
jgi:hypothetical protein